jgi:hypothetical protein
VPRECDSAASPEGVTAMPRQQSSSQAPWATGSPRVSGSQATRGRRDRRTIPFPMASTDPAGRSDRRAAAMLTIATRGIRSRRDRRSGDRFDVSRRGACSLIRRPTATPAAFGASRYGVALLTPALLLPQERGHQARSDRGFRNGRFPQVTQSAIIMVPVCLCERQPRPISPGMNETVGWPAKQASGTM